jgi:hypothetical protein
MKTSLKGLGALWQNKGKEGEGEELSWLDQGDVHF